MFDVLDLFSAAAGGWSLGMHRAGFRTVAACENVAWRRALYAENNPGVPIYDDVRTVTGARLNADGIVPWIVVGSPPCQDISSANTTGRGVDGSRSGLYFEAIRIIGEVRPRWFALENSANLRTRGADRVLGALEALGYAQEAFVVGAGDAGANHERKRSWIIGFDPDQVVDPSGFRCEGGGAWRCRADGNDSAPVERGAAPPHTARQRRQQRAGGKQAQQVRNDGNCIEHSLDNGGAFGSPKIGDAKGDGRATGRPGGRTDADARLRLDAHFSERRGGEDRDPLGSVWPEWNGGLADHLRVDDGLSTWLAESRVAVGGARGTSGSSLLVEAFGDAVIPQIPEVIGRAILRTEAALAAAYGAAHA